MTTKHTLLTPKAVISTLLIVTTCAAFATERPSKVVPPPSQINTQSKPPPRSATPAVRTNLRQICWVHPAKRMVQCKRPRLFDVLSPTDFQPRTAATALELARAESVAELLGELYGRAGVRPQDTLISCGGGVLASASVGTPSKRSRASSSVGESKKAALFDACTRAVVRSTGIATPGSGGYTGAVSNAVATAESANAKCGTSANGTVAVAGPVVWAIFEGVGVAASIYSGVVTFVDQLKREPEPSIAVEIGTAEVVNPPVKVEIGPVTGANPDGSTTTTYIKAETATNPDGSTTTTIKTTTTTTKPNGTTTTETSTTTTTTTTDGGTAAASGISPAGNQGGQDPQTLQGGDCVEMDCSSTCAERSAWWGEFKAWCDSSGWRTFDCVSFVAASNANCADPTLVSPMPDGEWKCTTLATADTIRKVREAFCKAQQGVMNPGPDGIVSCRILVKDNVLTGKSRFNICNDPRARPSPDSRQCSIDITVFDPKEPPQLELPGGSPRPPRR